MEEVKKTYSVLGTVTIGTDEYRDLIESCVEAQKDAEYNSNKRWEEYLRANKLEEELKELRAKAKLMQTFLETESELLERYKDWLAEGIQKEVK